MQRLWHRFRRYCHPIFGAAVLAVVMCSVMPVAADLAKVRVADKDGDHRADFNNLLPIAKDGNAEAQFAIGELFYLGLGVDKDYKSAAMWFHKLAEKGVVEYIAKAVFAPIMGTSSRIFIGINRGNDHQNILDSGESIIQKNRMC